MNSSGRGKIVRETEWMTVYEQDSGEFLYESKFLVGNLEISANSIKQRWQSFSARERYDLVHAFQAKPFLTSEDEKILDFLMEVGDINIWIAICSLLPRHRHRQRILDFLIARIAAPEGPKANFYQAVEMLGGPRSVGALKSAYLTYGDLRVAQEPAEKIRCLDYLQCCRALWILSGEPEYEQEIRRFLSADDEDTRRWAERFLASR